MRPSASNTVATTTKWLSRTAVLLAMTVAIQLLGLPQLVTGPVVNAMLLLTALTVGPSSGVLVGICTPFIALYRGILLPPLAPMVPFIGLSNAAFVIVFSVLWKRQVYVGLAAAALAKFLILSTAVRFIITVPEPIAYAMQIPQLVTAVTGGVVALIIRDLLRRWSLDDGTRS